MVVPALDWLVSLRDASWIVICGFALTETTDGDDLHRAGLDGYGGMIPQQGLGYCLPHHAINLGANGLGRNIVEYSDIRRTALEKFDSAAINC